MELKILFYVLFHRYRNTKTGQQLSGGFLTVVLSNLQRITFCLGGKNWKAPDRDEEAKLWLLYFSDVLKETGKMPPKYRSALPTLEWEDLPPEYMKYQKIKEFEKLEISGIEEHMKVENNYDISTRNLYYQKLPLYVDSV
jgi:hypothetical protein